VGIGHVVGPGGGDQSAMVEGQGWLGHVPTDFTHLRVQFDQRAPCYSTRTIAVPIHWFMDAPAGVEEDGFRAIAFPNPSSGVCVIPFHVPSEGPVSIDVVDVSGRIIRRLLQGSRPAGMHSVLWNGMGERNRPVPAGVYLTRISTTERTTTGRIVLTR
jgi:hypothetical protein